jgi:probable HAF family extracellular repeat protein
LNGRYSHALAINEKGDIVGDADTPDAILPVVWRAEAGYPASPLSATHGYAQAVSPGGRVAGVEVDERGWRLVVWTEGGREEGFRAAEHRIIHVTGLNDGGEVVGFTSATAQFSSESSPAGFRWAHGRMRALPTLGGAESRPASVAGDGTIVGWSRTAQGAKRACAWRRTSVNDLGTLGGAWSAAYGVAAGGQIVGEAQTAAGDVHACAWDGDRPIDLDDPAMGVEQRLSSAVGVNRAGQILGQVSDTAAFVLSPAERPARP